MPKKRISTRTQRQKAAAANNLKKARAAANNARSANRHGDSKAAGYAMKKASMFRAAAAGQQRGKKRTATIEPKPHARQKPRKARVRKAA